MKKVKWGQKRLPVVRKITGLSQQKLSELVEYSQSTIQSVELGRLDISNALARRISYETGVSKAWLLGQNPSRIPIDDFGEEFTAKTFEQSQKDKTSYKKIDLQFFFSHKHVLQILVELLPIYAEAASKGRGELLHFRMIDAIREVVVDEGFTAAQELRKYTRAYFDQCKEVTRSFDHKGSHIQLNAMITMIKLFHQYMLEMKVKAKAAGSDEEKEKAASAAVKDCFVISGTWGNFGPDPLLGHRAPLDHKAPFDLLKFNPSQPPNSGVAPVDKPKADKNPK